MLSKFEGYLEPDFSIDYWYDEGVGIASTMLVNFDEQDWKDLSEICMKKSVEWQVRCAEVLDSVVHPTSTEILMKFLTLEADDLVVAAADSLRSKDAVQVSSDLIEKIKHLSLQGSAPIKLVLNEFLSRICRGEDF